MVDIKLDPRLHEPLDKHNLDTQGFERPRELLDQIEEDLTPLLSLAQRPVVSARQFTREQLTQLARLAARYETPNGWFLFLVPI